MNDNVLQISPLMKRLMKKYRSGIVLSQAFVKEELGSTLSHLYKEAQSIPDEDLGLLWRTRDIFIILSNNIYSCGQYGIYFGPKRKPTNDLPFMYVDVKKYNKGSDEVDDMNISPLHHSWIVTNSSIGPCDINNSRYVFNKDDLIRLRDIFRKARGLLVPIEAIESVAEHDGNLRMKTLLLHLESIRIINRTLITDEHNGKHTLYDLNLPKLEDMLSVR